MHRATGAVVPTQVTSGSCCHGWVASGTPHHRTGPDCHSSSDVGTRLDRKVVLSQCDNAAVVAIINSGSSRNHPAMQLRRCLAFVAASLDFTMRAIHIRGADNLAADALSRDNLPCYHVCCPQAEPQGTPEPPKILDVLLLRELYCTVR